MLQKNEHIYYQQVLSGLSEKAHEPLLAQMEALVQALQTSPVVRARRVDLLHVLQKFISAYYGNAPASSSDALVQGGEEDLGRFDVQPFGSVVIGIDNDTSDLDIVVLDRYFPHGCSDASIKLPHLYNMNNLASQLQRFSPLGDVVDIIPIRAKVPITKVKMSDGMAMDINVNEALGHKNTQLLKAYFDLVPNNLLPSLARFLKFHFKNRRLNDPSSVLPSTMLLQAQN